MKHLNCGIFLVLVLISFSTASAQNKGFTPDQVRKFHREFEYAIEKIMGQGELSRYIYLNMSKFWPHTTLRKNDTVPIQEFSYNLKDFTIDADTAKYSLKEWVYDKPGVDGMIIIHKGQIVFEEYPRMHSYDRHIWWSISKVVVGTAVAILEDRGLVDNQKSIAFYLPELNGTAWEAATVYDVINMASGIKMWDKYKDGSEFMKICNTMLGFPNMDQHTDQPFETIKYLPADKSLPGQRQVYNSFNTEVASWLVERITGESYATFIEREIWQKMGPEKDGQIISTPANVVFSCASISGTLRDLARFGFLFTNTGDKADIISQNYLDKIKWLDKPGYRFGTYQWGKTQNEPIKWFSKVGASGQRLMISPERDLVVAWFGNNGGENGKHQLNLIAETLIESGIFDP